MTPTQALEALAERMGIADNYRVTVTPLKKGAKK